MASYIDMSSPHALVPARAFTVLKFPSHSHHLGCVLLCFCDRLMQGLVALFDDSCSMVDARSSSTACGLFPQCRAPLRLVTCRALRCSGPSSHRVQRCQHSNPPDRCRASPALAETARFDSSVGRRGECGQQRVPPTPDHRRRPLRAFSVQSGGDGRVVLPAVRASSERTLGAVARVINCVRVAGAWYLDA